MDELINRDERIKKDIRSWVIGAMIPVPIIALVVEEPVITLLCVVIVHCVLISAYLIYQLCKSGA